MLSMRRLSIPMKKFIVASSIPGGGAAMPGACCPVPVAVGGGVGADAAAAEAAAEAAAAAAAVAAEPPHNDVFLVRLVGDLGVFGIGSDSGSLLVGSLACRSFGRSSVRQNLDVVLISSRTHESLGRISLSEGARRSSHSDIKNGLQHGQRYANIVPPTAWWQQLRIGLPRGQTQGHTAA